MARVLVTGGAGYVGSHAADALLRSGHQVVVVDNLTTGHRQAVPQGAEFVEGDLRDRPLVGDLMANGNFDAIMHFAALSLVGESVERPFYYLQHNVQGALHLIEAAVDSGVGKFVFSSTANLFGEPERVPIDETCTIEPGSPYGESKYVIERALAWAERLKGLRYACLRYFNAAGADPMGARGEDHTPETHLIPIVLQVALGQRDHLTIFGDDYDTEDGTCVRDYVHVCDLADAHVLALDALNKGSWCLNLGSGHGHSVQEVIQVAREVTGHPIPAVMGERRAGDPATLVASSQQIRDAWGWTPRFGALRQIIETAWGWHRAHPNGYEMDAP